MYLGGVYLHKGTKSSKVKIVSFIANDNECLQLPCQNGATCICLQGWTGQLCDIGNNKMTITIPF